MTSSTPSADKVYKWENAEIGYREGANNANKYAAMVGVPNNDAWCMTFQSAAFKKSGFQSLAPMVDYTGDAINWYRAKGRTSDYPALGAQVYYGPNGLSHVGFVFKYDANYIWAIEGNEGDAVTVEKRLRRDDYVFLYGYPDYSEGIVTADPNHGVAGSRYAASGELSLAAVTTPPVTTPPVTDPPVTTPPVTDPPVTTPPVTTPPALTLEQRVARLEAKVFPDGPPVVVPPVDTTDYTLYPGYDPFEDGEDNGYIKQLTTWLKARGGTVAITSKMSATVRAEIVAFQTAQGWTGGDADGFPGETSWAMLKDHTGADIGTTPPAGGGDTAGPLDEKTGVSYARYTAGGSVAQWIAGACAARGFTSAAAVANWTKGYQTAIARESSGDANACNTNDSNNKTPAGYSKVADYGTGYGNPSGNLGGQLVNYQCSRGVAQCIPQTFAANHCAGTSNMIYDPVANIAASMGYVMAQYHVSADGSDLASKVQQFDPSRSPAGY